MSESSRAGIAVGTLAAILAITAGWWALALWPIGQDAARWLVLTREVCFGSTRDGLPNAGGWVLLMGQPIAMLTFVSVVWGSDLRAGIGHAMTRVTGQLAIGAASALIVTGLSSAVVRVRTAGAEPFSTGAGDIAAQLTRVNDAAPALALTDQAGREVTLASFRGRPVLVGFAFAHCRTVCPLIVSDLLTAQQRLGADSPAVLIVTLDPWRDTPGRLPSMAREWHVSGDAHVLSGPPELVQRTLNAWRVPRVRNEKTGDISHPSMIYVVGADSRIAYVVSGGTEAVVAAVRAL